MRVLVLGGGGREHAIVSKIAASPQVSVVYVAPGNGGTAGIATNVSINAEDCGEVLDFARANSVALVIIGPEAPLVAGVADGLREAGAAVFGPGASGARLEGSKAFAKALMERHGIPTGAYRAFTDRDAAQAYLTEVGAPVVVKADGLAAGKGVTVAMDVDTAAAAIDECFDGRFGDAGTTVVVEEYLSGPECSLLAFVSGRTVKVMAPAQDHKRAYDDDEGPNTGGMGVYSPVPIVGEAELEAMTGMLQATADALANEGIDYRGVLYGGFILTDSGPQVLEFNARFGDPETQVLLPRLVTDLVDVAFATASGRLNEIELEWTDDKVVSVVMASGGYPGDYATGLEITGIEAASALPGVTVYHAGTKVDAHGRLLTAGGRVLNVTATGSTFSEAKARAYAAVDAITFEGEFHRTDIGAKAIAAAGETGS